MDLSLSKYDAIMAVVQTIPAGKVATYGQISFRDDGISVYEQEILLKDEGIATGPQGRICLAKHLWAP